MTAIVIHAPHDLRIEPFAEAEGPPAPGEIRLRMAAGGICGSDLHYYHHGGFGTVRIREPMALGHEASGIVEAVGPGVTGFRTGDLVAVNPSEPCETCEWCRAGRKVHCENMRFNGSAMRFPHVQGLFRRRIDIPAGRAFAMPAGVEAPEAALCEPLAVCLHAAGRAGDLAGATVLVSGCGPIGLICIAVARLRGAARIIATDLTRHCLDAAAGMGASMCLDLSGGASPLEPLAAGRGAVDVMFECSGSPRALEPALRTLRPHGRAVLVGLGGDAPLPVNTVVTREATICGTFRFADEFGEAARLIGTRTLDLRPLISAVYPKHEAVAAFEHAGDRNRATKIAIVLTD